MPHTSVELLRAAGSTTTHHATAATSWESGLAVAVLVMLVLAGVTLAVLRMPPYPGGDEDADSGPGRGGPGNWPPAGPLQPEGEPEWWPEFERQFAAHVAGRGPRVTGWHGRHRAAPAADWAACGLNVCESSRGGTSAGRWLWPGSRLSSPIV